MTEQTIDIEAQEVVESPEVESETPNIRINDKELAKVLKQYKRYRKSTLSEIRRLDGATQYDNPF
jgi:predicted metal-dependent phosphoesterase TrpH